MAGWVTDKNVVIDKFTADFFGMIAKRSELCIFGWQSANAIVDVH